MVVAAVAKGLGGCFRCIELLLLSAMVDDPVEVARIIEAHEALVWSTCVEATAAVPGNPLKAEVDRSGNTPLCTLAALNFASFNRVIAFGVVTPATDEDIEVVRDFYSSRSGTRYVIEVTPARST